MNQMMDGLKDFGRSSVASGNGRTIAQRMDQSEIDRQIHNIIIGKFRLFHMPQYQTYRLN
jgi:hypothetical protein